jgi:hypothetical protein
MSGRPTTRERKHPNQPIGFDDSGKVIRFKRNYIVEWLATERSDLNAIFRVHHGKPGFEEDYNQLMQLIGYSVSGYGDLSTSPDATVQAADLLAEKLCQANEPQDG